MAITMEAIDRALAAKKKAKKEGSWHGFKSLTAKLKGRGARSPKALAAFIGRRKFGKKAFAAMGVAGKRGLSGD